MKSMLLIESPVLAKLFGEVLEKLGWTVAICTSRDCAMSHVAGVEPYDLILLSDHVPGTTGIQLIRFIRSLDHRLMTAVVMVAGSPEVTDEAKAAGADEVLVKPVNVSTLIWAVGQARLVSWQSGVSSRRMVRFTHENYFFEIRIIRMALRVHGVIANK